MFTTLLIFHALVSVALLGAITHQLASVLRRPGGAVASASFIGNFRSVRAFSYTNAIVLLYVVTLILGCVIYPPYRLDIRSALDDLGMREANGAFEIKEHFAAIGLFLLPAYWAYWNQPAAASVTARRALTAILAGFVWWNFLVGHILNNIKGFGQ